jgi:aspartate/methionine/tyrosine aminotransferase
MPAAGQFAFPWIGGDDLRFAKFLKERMKLSVVPGSAWGAQGKGHLRIALANAEERQQEGLRRLREGLERYEEA